MCPVHDPNGVLRLTEELTGKADMPTSAPARKVVGASAGAGVGGVFAGLILWALGAYVFAGDVPEAVSAFVYVIAPLALSFVGGYVTKRSTAEVRLKMVDDGSADVPAPAPAKKAAPVAAKKAAPVKKAPAKKAAKKAAPKPPDAGLS